VLAVGGARASPRTGSTWVRPAAEPAPGGVPVSGLGGVSSSAEGTAARWPELRSTEAGGGARAVACICNLQPRNTGLTETSRQAGKVISFIACCLYSCPASSRFRLEAQLIMV